MDLFFLVVILPIALFIPLGLVLCALVFVLDMLDRVITPAWVVYYLRVNRENIQLSWIVRAALWVPFGIHLGAHIARELGWKGVITDPHPDLRKLAGLEESPWKEA